MMTLSICARQKTEMMALNMFRFEALKCGSSGTSPPSSEDILDCQGCQASTCSTLSAQWVKMVKMVKMVKLFKGFGMLWASDASDVSAFQYSSWSSMKTHVEHHVEHHLPSSFCTASSRSSRSLELGAVSVLRCRGEDESTSPSAWTVSSDRKVEHSIVFIWTCLNRMSFAPSAQPRNQSQNMSKQIWSELIHLDFIEIYWNFYTV